MSTLIVEDLHGLQEWSKDEMAGITGGVGPAGAFIAGALLSWGAGKILDRVYKGGPSDEDIFEAVHGVPLAKVQDALFSGLRN